MKATVWMLLALLAAVMLLAACPRTNGEGDATNGEGVVADQTTPPPAGETNEAEALVADADGAEGAEADVADGADADAADADGKMQTETQESSKTMYIALFSTTKGDFTLGIHPEWSPGGAKHFIELVESGFYDGAPWFRVIDGFVAQCGVSADPAMNEQWGMQTIQDEPVVQGNKRGFVAFGQSAMPNSRSTHFFINLVDNSGGLDPQGFACFAEVIDGMDVVDSLARVEYADQGGLAAPGGLEKFKTQFPDADYIKVAKVMRMEPEAEGMAAGAAAPPAEETPEEPKDEGSM